MKMHLSLAILSLIATFYLSTAEPQRKSVESERKAEAQNASERLKLLTDYALEQLAKLNPPKSVRQALHDELSFNDAERKRLSGLNVEQGRAHIDGRIAALMEAEVIAQIEPERKGEVERKVAVAEGVAAAPSARSARPAMEAVEREGRGALEVLPATIIQHISEFAGPAEKKLELVHENVDMKLLHASGAMAINTFARNVTWGMAYNNRTFRAFMGADAVRQFAELFDEYGSGTFEPTSAPLLADYEFIPLAWYDSGSVNRLMRGEGRSLLRVHGRVFCAAITPSVHGAVDTIVSGIKHDDESLAQAIKKSVHVSAARIPSVYAIGPVSKQDKSGLCLLRDELMPDTGGVLLLAPQASGFNVTSILDNEALAMIPLGLSTRPHELIVWDAATDTFGYYDTRAKQYAAEHHIANIDQFGVPKYSLKPYSTLCIVHDVVTSVYDVALNRRRKSTVRRLTIFDPRLKPTPWITMDLPKFGVDVQELDRHTVYRGDALCGIGLKWGRRNELISVLLAVGLEGRMGTHVHHADIYHPVDISDFMGAATKPAASIDQEAAGATGPKLIKRLKGG